MSKPKREKGGEERGERWVDCPFLSFFIRRHDNKLSVEKVAKKVEERIACIDCQNSRFKGRGRGRKKERKAQIKIIPVSRAGMLIMQRDSCIKGLGPTA